jgi:hypothetical protein
MANYKDIEQEQLVGYWAKKKYGVKAKEFLTHKNWRDIQLLLTYRQEFERDWNQQEHNSWSSYWSMVVFKDFTLKGKYLRKLENIATGILQRRNKKHSQIQRIKALRNPYKKTGYDMMAKEPVADTTPPWDV